MMLPNTCLIENGKDMNELLITNVNIEYQLFLRKELNSSGTNKYCRKIQKIILVEFGMMSKRTNIGKE